MGQIYGDFDFEEKPEPGPVGKPIQVANICSNSFAIFDGDAVKDKPHLKGSIESAGGRAFILPCKEIEHLIPLAAMRAYVGSKLKTKFARESLQPEDYQERHCALGKLLDEKFKVKMFTEGASIRYKSALCNFAVDFMLNPDNVWELTPIATNLCKEIVAFITESNKGQPPPAPPLRASTDRY